MQFDARYGHDLTSLLQIQAPDCPAEFPAYWQQRYTAMTGRDTDARLHFTGRHLGAFALHELQYHSTDGLLIRGWALVPEGDIRRVMVVGHGFGGCHEPTEQVPLSDAAYLMPCLRGIGLSRQPHLPEAPDQHVLHGIEQRDHYILGGCVEDLWLAVSAAQQLFPGASNHIGMMGISFSGGIGIMALAWDKRVQRGHFQVPSFGHQPIRLELPSWGSAGAVQRYQHQHPEVIDTLAWFDAASAARFVTQPVHIAAALEDPAVAPPGQFAIYNALQHQRKLFVLKKGHMDYPESASEQSALLSELHTFFSQL